MSDDEKEEYKPKRGDIVQYVGGDGQVGVVLGWIERDVICMQDLETKKTVTGYFSQEFTVLMKKEEYENLIALPHTIELKDTEP
ncbi:MAG: hypothetical protein V1732_03315 [Patescibacteria group bacterium]|nr:hypothetical protein [Patescibacteria group bacterium]MBU4141300.1 hypothetical protein [Patescibacteria group bacterium]